MCQYPDNITFKLDIVSDILWAQIVEAQGINEINSLCLSNVIFKSYSVLFGRVEGNKRKSIFNKM